ncbi:hypothetical protein FB479_102135 [Brevibacillus sp. AG162]|uniref:discoidin domain-containing protein n=1 Tax=Brevibacillus sp. AG162 TaxID=2572910 RepID=UPI00116846DE|nr:discoidin domain-containing protein [Brevibacillus sp. AG162]TQK73506.1 hypothetical protein FB479_102135 [Brevibacillus sp. AG162]
MILTKRFSKQFFSFALMFSILFSGQNIGHAEDQYTKDLIPTMTSHSSPEGIASASSENQEQQKYFAYLAFDDTTIPDGFDVWASLTTSNEWLQFEFTSKKQIQKYTLEPKNYAHSGSPTDGMSQAPKDWQFQAWNGADWIVLDSQSGITDWVPGTKKEFMFNNSNSYNKYRIFITANNGGWAISLGQMEMMEKINSTPDPDPEPIPTGDNALLVIKMISGLEKEFELTASEVQDFIDWYNDRADGRGKETYMFDKDFNKGPFTARKDYVAFSKIQSFEVMEYTK